MKAPDMSGAMRILLIALATAALVILGTLAAPDTTAHDCHTDAECQALDNTPI